MFHDLDMALKGILADPSAPGELHGAQVSLLTPEKSYAPSENTVNLFLYDVKENRDLRDPVPIVERVNASFVRRRPPLRVDCSYLVTTWSTAEKDVKVQEEHQLLGQAFLWLSRFPTIPEKFLQGTFANQPFPPPTMVAQMDGTRNTAEFWTALGIPPRPWFNLVVTIAMDLGIEEKEGPPVTSKEIRLQQIGAALFTHSVFQIGGAVRDAVSRAPIAAVELTLVESGVQDVSDADGRFAFSGLAEGNYQLHATKQGYKAEIKSIHVPSSISTSFDVELTATS